MANYNDRFIVIHSEGVAISSGGGKRLILVDRETGVNYIFLQSGYAGGLTALLDADGKPVVTKITNQ